MNGASWSKPTACSSAKRPWKLPAARIGGWPTASGKLARADNSAGQQRQGLQARNRPLLR